MGRGLVTCLLAVTRASHLGQGGPWREAWLYGSPPPAWSECGGGVVPGTGDPPSPRGPTPAPAVPVCSVLPGE